MKQTLLKTLALGLLTVWGSQTRAGDFIDDATAITVSQNGSSVTPTIETVSGKKVLKFTTVNGSNGTKDAMIEFTFEGKDITPGQVFGVIEYTSNVKTGNNNRFRNLTLDGTALEEGSAANTLAFEPNDKKIIICPFLQNENGTEGKKMKTFYMANVDKASMSLTYAKVYAIMNAAETETEIISIGVYTLGEILEKYPSLKNNNWQINDSYRLLNDASSLGINNSKTNNGTDNGLIETKNAAITTAAGVKLWTKAVDFAKIPDNYRYFWCRFLQPAEAIHTDLFDGLNKNAVLMLSFGTGSNPHSVANLSTMHKKLIDFDRNMYNYTFVDGVNPTECAKVDVKGSQSTNYATYSRVLKAGYNSCAMPFKKIANASDVPAGISFYKVGALNDGKITFTKIADPTASNTFTDGTNWTPVIIHAETAGVYTFVGRDGIADLSGYKARTVGNSGNQLKWVGSFVEEKPTGDYLSTINYGITSDGSSFAKFGTDTKTSYYRAFLADGRGAAARELSLSFSDDDVTSISEELRVKNEELTSTAGYFNLAGQRVEKPTRGLYIVNGRKVVIK